MVVPGLGRLHMRSYLLQWLIDSRINDMGDSCAIGRHCPWLQ